MRCPPPIPLPRPQRAVFVTLLAWTIIVLGALFIPISVVSLLMILAGSYGTSTVDPIGFLIVVVAPAASLVGGIGLLRRRAWARYYVIGLLILLIAINGWDLLAGRPETTTYTSQDGVKTTVVTSYGSNCYQAPVIVICALLLTGLFWPSVREEFGVSRRSDALIAPATASPPTIMEPIMQPRRTRAMVPTAPARQRAALVLVIVILLGIAGGMGWLVTSGVSSGTTWFPAKRASQQRTVIRQDEPATFWLSIGMYGLVGAGAAGMALWCIRQGFRRTDTVADRDPDV